MHRRAALASVAVGVAGCLDLVTAPEPADAEAAIRGRLNDARAEAGVGTLPRSDHLHQTARDHSRDMADRGFYAHENPDGHEPTDRAGCPAGEVIHSGQVGSIQNVDSSETWSTTDADELAGYTLEGWRNSRRHRETIFDAGWQAGGVGVAIDDGEFYVTVVFC